MTKPKVSACIIAYNHENFIKDCLEGALSQVVDFDYEIIISEDCSTDSTRSILEEYQKKFPDKIKLFVNENNLGLIGNWVKALSLCQGDYIAICEGDDFWTDPYKLKKQIDFLENNLDFALSSHNANIIKYDKIIGQYCKPNHPEIINLEHLLEFGSGRPTCSLVLRNTSIQNLPSWFREMKACDWTIQVMSARSGKMKYFNEVMSTYRKHGTGANFSAKKEAQSQGKSDFSLPSKYSLEMIKNLDRYFDFKYAKLLRKQSTYWYYLYVNEYLKINDIVNAKKYAKMIFKEFILLNNWKNPWAKKKEFFKIIILVFLPIFVIKIIKNIK